MYSISSGSAVYILKFNFHVQLMSLGKVPKEWWHQVSMATLRAATARCHYIDGISRNASQSRYLLYNQLKWWVQERQKLACVAARRKGGKSKWAREGEAWEGEGPLLRSSHVQSSRASRARLSFPFGRLPRRLDKNMPQAQLKLKETAPSHRASQNAKHLNLAKSCMRQTTAFKCHWPALAEVWLKLIALAVRYSKLNYYKAVLINVLWQKIKTSKAVLKMFWLS